MLDIFNAQLMEHEAEAAAILAFESDASLPWWQAEADLVASVEDGYLVVRPRQARDAAEAVRFTTIPSAVLTQIKHLKTFAVARLTSDFQPTLVTLWAP